MINRTRKLFYEVAGTFYPSLEEAQKADLKAMIPVNLWSNASGGDPLVDWLLANAAAVANILTTTPRSRIRKPRKDKGVPRKVKQEVAS